MYAWPDQDSQTTISDTSSPVRGGACSSHRVPAAATRPHRIVDRRSTTSVERTYVRIAIAIDLCQYLKYGAWNTGLRPRARVRTRTYADRDPGNVYCNSLVGHVRVRARWTTDDVMKQPAGYGGSAGCRRRPLAAGHGHGAAWRGSHRSGAVTGTPHPYALRRPQLQSALHTEQLSTRMKRRDGAWQRIRDPCISLGPSLLGASHSSDRDRIDLLGAGLVTKIL
jgi:hypothetical protein